MSDEQSSKAIQEVAKTTRAAIPLVRDLGGFVAKLIGGPLEQASGIIEDKLAYVRFERGIRLRDKALQLMNDLGMDGPTRQIPLKVMVPLLQEATLEDDDQLQDTWARLLVNAARADSDVEVTRSLVSILSDFGPLEAMLLDKVVNAPARAKKEGGFIATANLPEEWIDVPEDKSEQLNFDAAEPSGRVEVALWNLVRLGCITPIGTFGGWELVSWVCPTALGKTLIRACTLS